MLQAFVSLKQQHPPRTESGMQGFFEALAGAVFGEPTLFCTNVDATPKAYSHAAAVQACLDPKCKFAVLRGESPNFWQATLLMPDKQGMGAIFFDLEQADGQHSPSIDKILDFSKKLYQKLNPRLIRVGDSEAREKLKSRHGLVLMPGLGRIEWLQIVHPDVYGSLYNPSELVAAPAHDTEIWEDGGLFLRVYGDPKDWDNEENIALANFIPGFLAGTANVQDGEKEKENVRNIEKLWNRVAKTAERAHEIFAIAPAAAVEAPKAAAATKAEAPKVAAPKAEAPKVEAPKAEAPKVEAPKAEAPKAEAPKVEAPKAEAPKAEAPKAEAPKVEAEPVAVAEAKPAEEKVAPARPSTEHVLASVAEVAPEVVVQEGTFAEVKATGFAQPLYSGQDASHSPALRFYAAWDFEEQKARVLHKLEDFAAFLHGESFTVRARDVDRIVACIKTYHKPALVYLASLDELPQPARDDARLAEFKNRVRAPHVDVVDETHELHVWAFNAHGRSLEEILVRQYEDWPLTVEVKRHVLDLPTAEMEDEIAPVEVLSAAPLEKAAGGSRTLLMVVLLLVLIAAALVFVFYFDADFTKLMRF